MTPDKKSLYITIALNEGERYRVDRTQVTGDLAQHGPEIRRLPSRWRGHGIAGRKSPRLKMRSKSILVSMVMPGRR